MPSLIEEHKEMNERCVGVGSGFSEFIIKMVVKTSQRGYDKGDVHNGLILTTLFFVREGEGRGKFLTYCYRT